MAQELRQEVTKPPAVEMRWRVEETACRRTPTNDAPLKSIPSEMLELAGQAPTLTLFTMRTLPLRLQFADLCNRNPIPNLAGAVGFKERL